MMKPQCVHSLASEDINISLIQSVLVPSLLQYFKARNYFIPHYISLHFKKMFYCIIIDTIS